MLIAAYICREDSRQLALDVNDKTAASDGQGKRATLQVVESVELRSQMLPHSAVAHLMSKAVISI